MGTHLQDTDPARVGGHWAVGSYRPSTEFYCWKRHTPNFCWFVSFQIPCFPNIIFFSYSQFLFRFCNFFSPIQKIFSDSESYSFPNLNVQWLQDPDHGGLHLLLLLWQDGQGLAVRHIRDRWWPGGPGLHPNIQGIIRHFLLTPFSSKLPL